MIPPVTGVDHHSPPEVAPGRRQPLAQGALQAGHLAALQRGGGGMAAQSHPGPRHRQQTGPLLRAVAGGGARQVPLRRPYLLRHLRSHDALPGREFLDELCDRKACMRMSVG